MINWTITNLEYEYKNGLEKVVKTIFWYAEKKDMFGYGRDFGWVNLDTDGVDPKTFIGFERLNQTKVIEWLHSALGEDGVKIIENAIETDYKSGNNNDQSGHGTPLRW